MSTFLCRLLYVNCSMSTALCRLLYVNCSMSTALCRAHNALCRAHNALCRLHNALCRLHNALCQLLCSATYRATVVMQGLVGANNQCHHFKALVPTANFLLLAQIIYHACVLYHYMYYCIVKDFIILNNYDLTNFKFLYISI